jgi:hypothetical protein
MQTKQLLRIDFIVALLVNDYFLKWHLPSIITIVLILIHSVLQLPTKDIFLMQQLNPAIFTLISFYFLFFICFTTKKLRQPAIIAIEI